VNFGTICGVCGDWTGDYPWWHPRLGVVVCYECRAERLDDVARVLQYADAGAPNIEAAHWRQRLIGELKHYDPKRHNLKDYAKMFEFVQAYGGSPEKILGAAAVGAVAGVLVSKFLGKTKK
jgi:hypothetical protein